MRFSREEGELMGPGTDLAMSLSGILMIVVFVTVAHYWRASAAKESQTQTSPPIEATSPEPGDGNKIGQLQSDLVETQKELNNSRHNLSILTNDISKLQGRYSAKTRELEKSKASLIDERRKRQAAEAALRTTRQRLARLNDRPPLITISDARFRTFEEASARIRSELRWYLRRLVPDLDELRKQYDADVIEVIGHTDEVHVAALKRQTCNLDEELLMNLNGRPYALQLEPCDNVGLGMARAAAVVNELRTLGLASRFLLLPLSAGQAIDTDGALATGDRFVTSIPARRRIEIRLRRRGE